MTTPPPKMAIDNPIDGEAIISDTVGEARVLHVEDDPAFADVVAEFLHRGSDSLAVTTVTDPRDALEMVREGDVDCVVSDYDMPGLDGLDVLKRVRETDSNLPFILFTGKGSEEIASEAISAGVTEYLQKGGGTDQYAVLANRIENAVAKHRAERQMVRGFSAIETAHDGISMLDGDGHFVYVNRAYAEVTGYDREELVGRHWECLYRDEDVDRVYDRILPQARAGTWEGKTVCVRKSGEAVTVDHALTYTEDGTLICTITEAGEVEQLLEELSLRERAMDEAPVGITIADAAREDNPLVYANDGFTAVTGYEKSEILGENCRVLQGEGTDEGAVAEIRRGIEDERPVTVELCNYRKDGTPFWNRVRITPITDGSGEVTHYVGVQEDVTDHRDDPPEG